MRSHDSVLSSLVETRIVGTEAVKDVRESLEKSLLVPYLEKLDGKVGELTKDDAVLEKRTRDGKGREPAQGEGEEEGVQEEGSMLADSLMVLCSALEKQPGVLVPILLSATKPLLDTDVIAVGAKDQGVYTLFIQKLATYLQEQSLVEQQVDMTRVLECIVRVCSHSGTARNLIHGSLALLQRPSTIIGSCDVLQSFRKVHRIDAKSSLHGSGTELYSFGRTDTGRLGLGQHTSTFQNPAVMESLMDYELAEVSTFSTHTLALTADGRVFGWGNGQHGRLGNSTIGNQATPVPIHVTDQLPIAKIAVGLSHSVLVSETGIVFTCGSGLNGRLGHGDTVERRSPAAIPDFSVPDPSSCIVACASSFSFLVTEQHVYSWGKGSAGQCGHGSFSDCLRPKAIDFFQDKTVVDIVGGWDHAVACTDDGSCYSWGCGYEGSRPVIGNGSSSKYASPQRLERLQEYNVVSVGAGYDHSLCVTSCGKVFAWGSNNAGQLGIGSTEEQPYPCHVTALDQVGVTRVVAGMDHSVAVTDDGNLYAWGNGTEHALGHESTQRRTAPVAVEYFNDKHVSHVSCGDKCTIVMTCDPTAQNTNEETETVNLNASSFLKREVCLIENKTMTADVVAATFLGSLEVLCAKIMPKGDPFSDLRQPKICAQLLKQLDASAMQSLVGILAILMKPLSDREGQEQHLEMRGFLLCSAIRVLKAVFVLKRRSKSLVFDAATIVELKHVLESFIATPKHTCIGRILVQEAAEAYVLGTNVLYASSQEQLQLLHDLVCGRFKTQFDQITTFGKNMSESTMSFLSTSSLVEDVGAESSLQFDIGSFLRDLVSSPRFHEAYDEKLDGELSLVIAFQSKLIQLAMEQPDSAFERAIIDVSVYVLGKYTSLLSSLSTESKSEPLFLSFITTPLLTQLYGLRNSTVSEAIAPSLAANLQALDRVMGSSSPKEKKLKWLSKSFERGALLLAGLDLKQWDDTFAFLLSAMTSELQCSLCNGFLTRFFPQRSLFSTAEEQVGDALVPVFLDKLEMEESPRVTRCILRCCSSPLLADAMQDSLPRFAKVLRPLLSNTSREVQRASLHILTCVLYQRPEHTTRAFKPLLDAALHDEVEEMACEEKESTMEDQIKVDSSGTAYLFVSPESENHAVKAFKKPIVLADESRMAGSISFWINVKDSAEEKASNNGKVTKSSLRRHVFTFGDDNAASCCPAVYVTGKKLEIVFSVDAGLTDETMGKLSPDFMSKLNVFAALSECSIYSKQDLDLHTWHHVVVTVKEKSLAVHIDGALSSTKKAYASLVLPGKNPVITFGKQSGSVQGLQGLLKDLRFYNQPLDDTSIQSLSTEQVPIQTAAPLLLSYSLALLRPLILSSKNPEADSTLVLLLSYARSNPSERHLILILKTLEDALHLPSIALATIDAALEFLLDQVMGNKSMRLKAVARACLSRLDQSASLQPSIAAILQRKCKLGTETKQRSQTQVRSMCFLFMDLSTVPFLGARVTAAEKTTNSFFEGTVVELDSSTAILTATIYLDDGSRRKCAASHLRVADSSLSRHIDLLARLALDALKDSCSSDKDTSIAADILQALFHVLMLTKQQLPPQLMGLVTETALSPIHSKVFDHACIAFNQRELRILEKRVGSLSKVTVDPIDTTDSSTDAEGTFDCTLCTEVRQANGSTLVSHIQEKHYARSPFQQTSSLKAECPLCLNKPLQAAAHAVHPNLWMHIMMRHANLISAATDNANVPQSEAQNEAEEPSDPFVLQLVDMGFEPDHAVFAMEYNGGNVMMATEWLLNNGHLVEAMVESKRAAEEEAREREQEARRVEELARSAEREYTKQLAESHAQAFRQLDFFAMSLRDPTSERRSPSMSVAGLDIAFPESSLDAEVPIDDSIQPHNKRIRQLQSELAVLCARAILVHALCMQSMLSSLSPSALLCLLQLSLFRGDQFGFNDALPDTISRSRSALSSPSMYVLLQDTLKSFFAQPDGLNARQVCLEYCIDTLECIVSSNLYDVVNWGERSRSLNDQQAVSVPNLERAAFLLSSMEAPAVPPSLLEQCLCHPNVYLKNVGMYLLQHTTPPCVSYRTLFSTIRATSPDALSKQCLLVSQPQFIPESPPSSAPRPSIVFDASSSSSLMRLSSSALSVTHTGTNTWDIATLTLPIAFTTASQHRFLVLSFALDRCSSGRIGFGLIADGCSRTNHWTGSHSSMPSYGFLADGSVWETGQARPTTSRFVKPSHTVTCIVDLHTGAVRALMGATDVEEVTCVPTNAWTSSFRFGVCLFEQDDAVSLIPSSIRILTSTADQFGVPRILWLASPFDHLTKALQLLRDQPLLLDLAFQFYTVWIHDAFARGGARGQLLFDTRESVCAPLGHKAGARLGIDGMEARVIGELNGKLWIQYENDVRVQSLLDPDLPDRSITVLGDEDQSVNQGYEALASVVFKQAASDTTLDTALIPLVRSMCLEMDVPGTCLLVHEVASVCQEQQQQCLARYALLRTVNVLCTDLCDVFPIAQLVDMYPALSPLLFPDMSQQPTSLLSSLRHFSSDSILQSLGHGLSIPSGYMPVSSSLMDGFALEPIDVDTETHVLATILDSVLATKGKLAKLDAMTFNVRGNKEPMTLKMLLHVYSANLVPESSAMGVYFAYGMLLGYSFLHRIPVRTPFEHDVLVSMLHNVTMTSYTSACSIGMHRVIQEANQGPISASYMLSCLLPTISVTP